MHKTVRVKIKGTHVTLMFPINFTTEAIRETLEVVFEKDFMYDNEESLFYPVGETPDDKVFKNVKVRSASGLSELPFPIGMRPVAIAQYLSSMLKKDFTYNEVTDEYIMAEEEPLPITVAAHLRNLSEEARVVEHEKYVEYILEQATKAAASGAEKTVVSLDADAYHCRYQIGYELKDKGFCVQTEMKKIRFREVFYVEVDWSKVQVTAPYHKDKED